MEIRELAVDEIDRLEPLWLELHAHHQAIAPELAPFVDDVASWSVRRALYETTLADGGFALVLEDEGVDLGYVLVGEERAHWPASLLTEPRAFEIHTLLVSAGVRGRGAGSALLDAVDERLTGETADRYIGVVPGNARAAALYERRGFVPTVLALTRFGRPEDAPAASVDPDVELVLPSELEALESLWLELHHHHQRVAKQLAPYVDDAPSWIEKRKQLVSTMETGRILRLGPADAPLGMASFAASDDIGLWADTWVTGRKTAELKAIIVAERARGQGVGRRLMDSVDALLATDGIPDQSVAAFVGNDDAIELYRRRGFRPAWLTMVDFALPRTAS